MRRIAADSSNLSVEGFDYTESEVVLGVVAPVGTDLSQLTLVLEMHLKRFRYELNVIKLSDFLKIDAVVKRHGIKVKGFPDVDRVNTLMDAGNKTRRVTGQDDIMAQYAASVIGSERKSKSTPATVHLIDSLKRPEEVLTLRRIYGPGFFLIGVYSPESERKQHLEEREMSERQAEALIKRDQDEEVPSGQRTRATFQLADVFVRLDNSNLDEFQSQVKRFVDLVFGCPFATPTEEEHAMFLAYAASLRSADLSRQVGAVVVSDCGEVISTGANDVPKFGGGLYGPGQDDNRDHIKGIDSNKVAIEEIAQDIIRRLAPKRGKLRSSLIEQKLAGSKLQDLTEFGRAVHAEMEAIACCARVGVSPRNGKMFTTTFPCHNCAKHIVAAGLIEVQYVEPYPKSRALALHGDEISFEEPAQGKVHFKPFVGITARRYFDLFSMQLSDGHRLIRKNGAKKIDFDRAKAFPRVPMPPASYIEREKIASKNILATITGGEENAKTSRARGKRLTRGK